jgi:hypothetical protein
MPKRSSSDLIQIAYRIVQQSIENGAPTKNPAAVALWRLGGLKGGKARTEALTKERKIEKARKAAISRWKNKSH